MSWATRPLIRRQLGQRSVDPPHVGAVETSAHQRKAVCVKRSVDAASVVCPCIAVNRAVPGSV